MTTRRALIASLAAAAAAGALPAPGRAAPAPRRVPNELAERALAFPAAARVGTARDVVFVEFFDYNCPWCRRSAAEVEPLVEGEGVSYLLVNHPILSEASLEAARIALGFLAVHGDGPYLALHRAVFAGRGLVDGARVLDAAARLGADVDAVGAAAALPGVEAALDDILRIGRRLGFDATPSTLVGPFAFDGYLPLERKRAIVADLRA